METIDVKYLTNSDLQINEEYRTLRRSIQMFGSNIKTIGLTSCSKDNWKSLVAINLAASIVEAGKKIILVVADNYSAILSDKVTIPVLEKSHNCNLLSDSTEEKLIYHTDIENLDLAMSDIGYPNTSKKSDKDRFVKLIKKIEDAYDYILLEIPPLDAPSYEAEMAKACDGMILVVKAYTVDYKTGIKAKNMLEKSDCAILGAVLIQEA